MSLLKFKFHKSGIAKRLITYMVIFSAFITALITVLQLFLDYNKDVNLINDQLQQIPQIHLNTLTASLWAVDNKELKIHLEGILQTRDIQFLAVRENEDVVLSVGNRNAENVISQTYPMVHTQGNKKHQIGTLIVEASLDGIYKRLIDKVWVILISNGIKTFLVASFMLLLFYQLNTRHLINIANFTTKLETDNLGNQLDLERNKKDKQKDDELDLVVNAINQMQSKIHKSFNELKQSEEYSQKLTQELQLHKEHLEELVKVRTNDLVTAKDEAESANAAKSEFLSSMSHELRTPLNAILGFAQLMELDAEDLNEDQNSNVHEILDAGNHLLNLVNEVLDLAKVESGKLEVYMEVIHIDDLIHDCIVLIKNQAEERQLQIIENLSNKGYSINADRTRLKQVLVNLLSNAVKYNSKKGCITLDGKLINNQYLRISITDKGQGLTKDDIDNLFSSFERLNKSENVEGAGIGLVITKHLVELMNGRIGVKSTPGKGSTFWVEFDLTMEVDNDIASKEVNGIRS